MSKTNIKDNLLIFKELTSNGVVNACTFSNTTWGNMRLGDNNAPKKYDLLFNSLNLQHKHFAYLIPNHNDNVQILTKENITSYKYFNKFEKWNDENEKRIPFVIETDAIVTTQSIPIVIAPADCYVLVINGVDDITGEKLIGMAHLGLNGTILNLQSKLIGTILWKYSVNVEELEAFLYPGISSEKYVKKFSDKFIGDLPSRDDWFDHTTKINDDEFIIDIESRIKNDLISLGLPDSKIHSTDLDTHEEQGLGNLYSRTYQKENDLSFENHAVIACLN